MSKAPSGGTVTVVFDPDPSPDGRRRSFASITDQTLRTERIVVLLRTEEDRPALTELIAAEPRAELLDLTVDQATAEQPLAVERAVAEHAGDGFVIFVDPGGSLELHAAKNLLLAAESAPGTELVIGRVEPSASADTDAELDRPRGAATLADEPGLGRDRRLTGRLIGTDLLRRAIEATDGQGRHALLAHCYRAAARIGHVPELVYQAGPARLGAEAEVSALVAELIGLAESDDPAVAGLAGSWIGDLIRGPLIGFLGDAYELSGPDRRQRLATLRPLVEAAPEDAFDEAPPMLRAAWAMVLLDQPEGLRQALMYRRRDCTLAGRIVTDDQGRSWQPAVPGFTPPEPGSVAERLLRIEDPRFTDRPLRAVHFNHMLTSVVRRGGRVTLRGVTHDPLRKLAGTVTGSVLAERRNADGRFEVPLTFTARPDQTLEWEAEFAFPPGLAWDRPQVWGLYLRFLVDDRETVGLLRHRLSRALTRPIPAGGQAQRLLRRGYRLYRTKGGNVGLRLQPARGRRGQVDRLLTGAGNRVRTRLPRLDLDRQPSREWVVANFPRLQRLPLHRNTVLVESHMGQSGWDHPRYVVEELRRLRPGLKIIWVTKPGFPSEQVPFPTVIKNSLGYVLALARSEFLIDNQSLPTYFWQRPGQRYLQTWHGTPLKTMGLDEPNFAKRSAAAKQGTVDRANRWDALVVPNEHFEKTFVPAFGYRGRLLRYGSPRNDVLVTDAGLAEEYRRRLDLPTDRKIILYAPTFRKALANRSSAIQLPFDLDWWREELGQEYYLLVRAHYLNRVEIGRDLAPYCLDVSDVDNINELYLASDLLITDYSSVMFDYATLRRPMLFFCYDYDDYTRDERGTYLDLKEIAPGPFVTSADQLAEGIRTAGDDRYRVRRKEFFERFCSGEDGHAAERSARFLLGLDR
ncbi:CDP-glycerol glycerophosphotransferase family protein [Microlunatus speluncae]|uniref:CDP-glycerol glycerophosphotransferase family protein n=1 Tax=Microlunatus speluncae TaxID=2594267 RepID=UPI0012667110|nr:CDP-glycerol glycerophosphotransferase family protein [Microlunatus speluncae]